MAAGGLKGAVCLITGGAGALGRAIGAALRGDGAEVVLADLVFSDAPAQGELHLDVTDAAAWDRAIAAMEARFGRLDVLVNAAGILGAPGGTGLAGFDPAAFRAVQRVNVEGTVLGCAAAMPLMRRGGQGSIVNLASIAAITPTPNALAYGASKAAVVQLTRSLAIQGAPDRIRCNVILPGPIESGPDGMMASSFAQRVERGDAPDMDTAREAMIARVPMGRLGTPEDIAYAALYLASPGAGFVTGSLLVVAGGIDL